MDPLQEILQGWPLAALTAFLMGNGLVYLYREVKIARNERDAAQEETKASWDARQQTTEKYAGSLEVVKAELHSALQKERIDETKFREHVTNALAEIRSGLASLQGSRSQEAAGTGL